MKNVLMFLAVGQVLDVATFSVVYREFPFIVIAEVLPFVPLLVVSLGLWSLWAVKGAVTVGMAYIYPRARGKARWATPMFLIVAASGYVGCLSNVIAYLTLRSMS